MTGTCNRFRSPRRRPVPAFRRIRMHRLPSGTPADSAATTAGASDLKNPRRWRSQRNGSGVVRIGRAGPAGYSEPSTNASAVLDMGPSLLILAIAPADLRQLPRKTKGSVQIRRRNGGQKNRLNPQLGTDALLVRESEPRSGLRWFARYPLAALPNQSWHARRSGPHECQPPPQDAGAPTERRGCPQKELRRELPHPSPRTSPCRCRGCLSVGVPRRIHTVPPAGFSQEEARAVRLHVSDLGAATAGWLGQFAPLLRLAGVLPHQGQGVTGPNDRREVRSPETGLHPRRARGVRRRRRFAGDTPDSCVRSGRLPRQS